MKLTTYTLGPVNRDTNGEEDSQIINSMFSTHAALNVFSTSQPMAQSELSKVCASSAQGTWWDRSSAGDAVG